MVKENPVYINPFPLSEFEKEDKDTFTQEEIRSIVTGFIDDDFVEPFETGPFGDFENIWGEVLAGRGAKLTPQFIERMKGYQNRIKGVIDDMKAESLRTDHTEPIPTELPEVPDISKL